MKKILFAILTIFTITTQSWGDGFTVTGRLVTISDNIEDPIVGENVVFTEYQNFGGDSNSLYTTTDEQGYFSLEIPNAGYIHITPIGAEPKAIRVNAQNTDLGTIEIESDNELEVSTVTSCSKDELLNAHAENGIYANNQCQPTKCKTPRYKLKIDIE